MAVQIGYNDIYCRWSAFHRNLLWEMYLEKKIILPDDHFFNGTEILTLQRGFHYYY